MAGWNGVTTRYIARFVLKDVLGQLHGFWTNSGSRTVNVTSLPTNKYEVLSNIGEELKLGCDIMKSYDFVKDKICNRLLEPQTDQVPTWEKDGELMKDIVEEYEFYRKWRKKCTMS